MFKPIYLITIILTILICGTLSAHNNQLSFVENKGQWQDDIHFVAKQNGLNIIIKNDGIYFDVNQIKDGKVIGNVVKMNFLNNKNNFPRIKDAKSISDYNYFFGNNPDKWIMNAKGSDVVYIENLYEGIDFKMYVNNESKPQYDFILQPFANPNKIKFELLGANSVSSNNDNLIIKTGIADLINNNLFVYQEINSIKEKIDAKFKVNSNIVSFEIGDYDKSLPLTIDPIVFSSYYGTPGDDEITCVSHIDDNHFVVAGVTNNPDFQTNVGAYQEEYADLEDIFITLFETKFGDVKPLSTTYFGSLNQDFVTDIVADLNGEIVITGYTNSPDFPMLNSFGMEYKGNNDAFVAKFSRNLDVLRFSALHGGTGDDYSRAVDIDKNNNIYFTGSTNSNDMTVEAGKSGSVYMGKIDIMLASCSSNGGVLRFSNYIGGTNDDEALDIFILRSTGEIFLTGTTLSAPKPIGTSSPGFPIWPEPRRGSWSGWRGGAADLTYNGLLDAFAMHLFEDAKDIESCTYIGGDGDDIGKAIYANNNKDMFVVGMTKPSSDLSPFPITEGVFQSQHRGGWDLFMTKVNAPVRIQSAWQTSFDFSTYIGSNRDDFAVGFLRNPAREALGIVGVTSSRQFPVIANSDRNFSSENDVVYFEMDLLGKEIVYSAAFGGVRDDFATDFSYNSFGSPLIVGYTLSNDYVNTPNNVQKSNAGNKDGFITQNVKGSLSLTDPSDGEIICRGRNLDITWTQDNLSIDQGFNLLYGQYNEDGTMKTHLIEENYTGNSYTWNVPSDIPKGNNYFIRVAHPNGYYVQNTIPLEVRSEPIITEYNAQSDTEICQGQSFSISVLAEGTNLTYKWFRNNTELQGQTSSNLTIENALPNMSGNYNVQVTGSCEPVTKSDNIEVVVHPTTAAGTLQESIEADEKTSLQLSVDAVGYELNYQWQKNGTNIIGERNKDLNFTSLNKNDQGVYRCIVNGRCGVDTTNNLTLEVKTIGNVYHTELNDAINVERVDNNIYKIIDKEKIVFGFTLMDNIGNIIRKETYNSNSTIDLNNYNTGIYWIIVNTDNKDYLYKAYSIK